MACKPSAQPDGADSQPLLTVAIEPIRYLTEAIAGTQFQVVSMVPKGSSPETYDPAPQQLMKLNSSIAYLGTGHLGFELAWAERFKTNAPQVQFFDLSRGIDLIREATDGHHHAHHGGVEPHIWSSTTNARILAANIRDVLCRLDSTHNSLYRARHDSLIRQINHTDSLIRQMLEQPQAARTFLIYHPALSYFARDYGLRQIAIEQGGKEPTPTYLATLMEQCRQQRVTVIFVQPEFDKRNADLIARQTGARVVPINPLDYQWAEQLLEVARALSNPSPITAHD